MSLKTAPGLEGKQTVFRDRRHAGRELARLLASRPFDDAVVVAIPAGGVPVAVAIAEALKLPIDVAAVSKITLPWNTEAGYGAIAFDGTVMLNQALVEQLPLTEAQIAEGIDKTRTKIERRKHRLRGGGGAPEVSGKRTILVDDGLASGFTMRVAIAAIRKLAPRELVVAVPTGHHDAVRAMEELADHVVCANVRGGHRFAVADAYDRWTDVLEVEADELLRPFRARDRPWAEDWPLQDG